MQLIPISHRCTELEGREWKEVFPLSINNKCLTGELQPIRNESTRQRLSLIDSVHRYEMGIIYSGSHLRR